jgi:ribose transport system substrate-binding protein
LEKRAGDLASAFPGGAAANQAWLLRVDVTVPAKREETLNIFDDTQKLRRLAQEATEFTNFSRRSLIKGVGGALGGAALSGLGMEVASAEEITPPSPAGKKVRIGVPLTYGPFNQPWRRGCWQIVQAILDAGCEVVTVRGEPTKASEQAAERALLDRGIDALVMGIYSQESETAYIADEAHKRGIKTVGFTIPVKDSPAVMDDVWGTATTLGYFVQNYTKRQGTFAQTAEQRGYFTPFDMEVDMFELMCRYEPRMKVLPFIDGGQGTSDEISVGRKNMLSLLQANPEPGSLAGFISWWWPFTLGAAQALKQMNRDDVPLFNHYLSTQILEAWAAKQIPLVFSCDSPFPEIGRKTGELAVKLARGEDVPNIVYRIPVITKTPDQAEEALAELKSMDEQAIALLKQYGG